MKKAKTTHQHPHPLKKLIGGLVALGFIVGGLTWADAPKGQAPKNDLGISLTARKVVSGAGGQEKLMPAERALPGEVIQYDALYVNQSSKTLNRVSPTLPIPEGMTWVQDWAKPAPAEASLDGRSFSAIPLKRKVTMPSGEEKEETVPVSEYRALRWHIGDMAAGARVTVAARTQINPAGR